MACFRWLCSFKPLAGSSYWVGACFWWWRTQYSRLARIVHAHTKEPLSSTLGASFLNFYLFHGIGPYASSTCRTTFNSSACTLLGAHRRPLSRGEALAMKSWIVTQVTVRTFRHLSPCAKVDILTVEIRDFATSFFVYKNAAGVIPPIRNS